MSGDGSWDGWGTSVEEEEDDRGEEAGADGDAEMGGVGDAEGEGGSAAGAASRC